MTTYAILFQDIQDWTEDDSAEFVAEVPSIITRAETQVYRDMPKNLEYNQNSTGALLASNRELLHGVTGLRAVRELLITNGANKEALDRRTESFIDLYTPDPTTTGVPKFYAQKDNDTILLAPTPDSAYSYTLRYRGLPTGLSASNTTTWFSTNQYDLLLDACLIDAYRIKEDDEGVARFTASYQAKLKGFAAETLNSYQNDDTTGV